MRRLILTVAILAAISLIGALLSAPATAQGDPVPHYESTVVATDDIGSRSVLSSEAQSGASPQVHPSVAKAQGSGDKPIYAELIERMVEFGHQILKRATDIAPPAFTRLDWKLKTASILMAFALLAGIYLKLKERAWPKIDYPTLNAPVTQPPSDLPAAAVSVLESRKVSLETLLAALIEMCQKDVLQVVGIRVEPGQATEGKNYFGEYEHIYPGKYIYWLVPKGVPQFEWERSLLEWIPKQPMMIDELIDDSRYILTEHHVAQNHRQLGEHLRYRGLFNDNPMQAMSDANRGYLAHFLGAASVCIGLGLLSYWLLSSWVSWPWWANLASGIVGGIVFGVIYAVVVEPSRIGHITPTRAGIQEISRWLALKESLLQFDPLSDADGSDSLLPYAIAFDEAERWLQDKNPAPFWFNSINLQEYTLNQNGQNGDDAPAEPRVPFALVRADYNLNLIPDNDEAYHAFMSAERWGLLGRSSRAAEANDDLNLIPDNDEAYHAFMSASGWGLLGRSSRAAEAAVQKQDNPKYSPPSGGGGGDVGGGGG